MSSQNPTEKSVTPKKPNPNAAKVEERLQDVKAGLKEDISNFKLNEVTPTACELVFDPLSRRFWQKMTGKNPQVWPDNSNEALKEVGKRFYFQTRDFAAWTLAAARLQHGVARTFFTRVEPLPEGTDGAEDYLYRLFDLEFKKLKQNHFAVLEAIVSANGKRIFLSKSKLLRFGISSLKPQGVAIETKEDCLNPLRSKVDEDRHPNLFVLAEQSAQLVDNVKSILLKNPRMLSDEVWALAESKIVDSEQFDSGANSVVSLPEEGTARMPHEEKPDSPIKISALAKDIEQAHYEGIGSLTRPSLRRIKGAVTRQLKIVDLDQEVRYRAIEEDILPLLQILFPDEIVSSKDVDGNSLTKLFEANAKSNMNVEPLDAKTLDSIKLLAQQWRKHFSHVKYKGEKVTVSSAGKYGLDYRVANVGRERLATLDTWPVLAFPE